MRNSSASSAGTASPRSGRLQIAPWAPRARERSRSATTRTTSRLPFEVMDGLRSVRGADVNASTATPPPARRSIAGPAPPCAEACRSARRPLLRGVGCANSVDPRNRAICGAIEFPHPTRLRCPKDGAQMSRDCRHIMESVQSKASPFAGLEQRLLRPTWPRLPPDLDRVRTARLPLPKIAGGCKAS
jgi:hypothetical protein